MSNPIKTPTRSALMVRSHHLSLIWIIPVMAALTAGALGLNSYINRGTLITIQFESASGLEAGRTKIKYKDEDLGTVEKVKLTSDLSHVVVTARMSKIANPYLGKNAHFWLVRPSLYTKDLSGVGTLISGAYIQFEPGSGEDIKHFIADDTPLIVSANKPGETFTLHATQLGSIRQGTPVFFHGVTVGEVLGYELSDKDGSATIHVFVQAPHNELVHKNTRFWNTSGITVLVGSSGLSIQLESIQSLLTGGIAFGTSDNAEPGPVATENQHFNLYADASSAADAAYKKRICFLLHFAQSVPGLVVGSPVRMQGLAIGQVKEVNIEYDKGHLSTPVIIEVEADRLKLANADKDSSTYESAAYDAFRQLVSSGLRAHLTAGNLLTGQKVIDLDLTADTPPATLLEGGKYPEIPTIVGDDMEALMHSARQLMGRLQELSATANTALKQTNAELGAGENGGDLAGTMQEIRDAARSLRTLTDYLEAHPEAILRGKPKDPKP